MRSLVKFLGFVLVFLVLQAALVFVTMLPAKAEIILNDRGGQIGHYLQKFVALRISGEPVIVDGNCLSACTLVLGLLPREQLYFTSRARLGFHAAWMPDTDGRPIPSPKGTQALWDIYPPTVRRWINRHGGLTRKMIYLYKGTLLRMGYRGDGAPPRTSRGAHARKSLAKASR